mgnify:FL=1
MGAVFWLDAGLRRCGTFGEGGRKGEDWAAAGAGKALEGEAGRKKTSKEADETAIFAI